MSKHIDIKPVMWLKNKNDLNTREKNSKVNILTEDFDYIRRFHRQIPNYKNTPLKSLSRLADHLGLGGLYVKDEGHRFRLGSFKALGGTFAIFRYIMEKIGADCSFEYCDLMRDDVKKIINKITFATATDGNHGQGVAWAARKLGCNSVVYVHKLTSQPRIDTIRENGATVVVVDGNYDDAVRQCNADAKKNGWEIISDTAWEGYDKVPSWVIQGYSTLFMEIQEQLNAQGVYMPTHVFLQAGVGSLAVAGCEFYFKLFGKHRPKLIVVEPDRAPCIFQSAEANLAQGQSISGDLNTKMAGLACGDPNPIAWKSLRWMVDAFIQVPDYVAGCGMRILGVPLEGDYEVISGESGAVTMGALKFIMQRKDLTELREFLELGCNSEILLINTERNTDPTHYREMIWEGSLSVPKKYRSYRSK
jgi:diaminopropionate ammonia-lyase